MPTVLRIGSFRFFFYSSNRAEPPHVHIECGDGTAKFWLDPVRLHGSSRLSRAEIAQAQRLVEDRVELLLEKWDEYFGN